MNEASVCAGTKSVCIQESPKKAGIHPWPHRVVQAEQEVVKSEEMSCNLRERN